MKPEVEDDLKVTMTRYNAGDRVLGSWTGNPVTGRAIIRVRMSAGLCRFGSPTRWRDRFFGETRRIARKGRVS